MSTEHAEKADSAIKHPLRNVPILFAAILTGLFAVAYTQILGLAETFLDHPIFTTYPILSLLVVTSGFISSWWLVHAFCPEAQGSGIPQLMAAVSLSEGHHTSMIKTLLHFKIIVIKSLSAMVKVAAGAPLGKEGPTLHIAGAIFFNIFELEKKFKVFHSHFTQRTMILAGGGAGLAAAFNTPLGGIAFVIEELSDSHLSAFRTPLFYAVLTAGLITQVLENGFMYLGVLPIKAFEMNQLLPTVILAIAAAITCTVLGSTLKALAIKRRLITDWKKQCLLAGVAGIAFWGWITFVSPSAKGAGRSVLLDMLYNGHASSVLETLSRFVGVVLGYGSGGAGGVFTPTLTLGGATASLVESKLLSLNTGILEFNNPMGVLGVLVGMTAGLSALTQCPLTSFIIILEMTDHHYALFPLMIAAILGTEVSRLLTAQTLYQFTRDRFVEQSQSASPL
jgi:H+/Cl- antiporter ClcA